MCSLAEWPLTLSGHNLMLERSTQRDMQMPDAIEKVQSAQKGVISILVSVLTK